MKILMHHIPKCAGTALANQFKNTLGLELYRFLDTTAIIDTIGEVDPCNQLTTLLNCPSIKNAQYTPCVNINDVIDTENIVLYAHKFQGGVTPLFNNPTWIKVTSFRDPFERFFSSYVQRQRNNKEHLYIGSDDMYQFYFFYKEWISGTPLELNDKTAPDILEMAISLLDTFDIIFNKATLFDDIKTVFGVNDLIFNVRNDNKTAVNTPMNILYDTAMKYCKYVSYDYEFYMRATAKKPTALYRPR